MPIVRNPSGPVISDVATGRWLIVWMKNAATSAIAPAAKSPHASPVVARRWRGDIVPSPDLAIAPIVPPQLGRVEGGEPVDPGSWNHHPTEGTRTLGDRDATAHAVGVMAGQVTAE